MLFDIFKDWFYLIESNRGYCTSVFITLILVYKLFLYPLFISPLRKVPGPYIHRITSFPALNGQRTLKWNEKVRNLHDKYGPIVILSPSEVSVSGDHQFINDIYVKNFPKSTFYGNFTNHGGKDNMFASLENDRHLKYKKLVLSLYSKSSIFSNKNPTRDTIVEKVGYLRDNVYESSVTGKRPDYINAKSEFNQHGKGHTDNGKWFNKSGKKTNLGIDVYPLFGSLAMDVVSSFELGPENGTDLLLFPEKRDIIISHRLQASMSFWTTLMPRFWAWAATPAILKASETIEKWHLKLYQRAEENVPKFEAGRNLTTLETFKKNGLKGEYAYSFLTDNIFAGHETTAIQLTYMTYELSRPKNHYLQKLLQEELFKTFGKPRDKNDLIKDLEIVDKLPILEAIFQENSRVHPSIPGAEPRVTNRPYAVTLKSGGKVVLPPGIIISTLPYLMHRIESVFPESETFKPERWLPYEYEKDADYEKRISYQQKYMMPFGKGVRMCLGMQLALIEMKLAVANLYWHFNSKIDQDWCRLTQYDDSSKIANPIKMGDSAIGANESDEEKMVMVDTYTTRPYNDECWLQWYEN